ncbi:hypothetical protein AGLY_016255 [Aphis glycines]|uniref:Uncharacterized protein n=1 Tax=Aphis glycines TaxID=307491 RepID=A0A6G0T077_APHGL|nr:hypothetical protein AGLY_016255 [Aphis glycines]
MPTNVEFFTQSYSLATSGQPYRRCVKYHHLAAKVNPPVAYNRSDTFRLQRAGSAQRTTLYDRDTDKHMCLSITVPAKYCARRTVSEFIIIQPYQYDIITRLYTHVLIMDVLNSLQRQTNVLNLSIGELTKDIEYRVQSMNNVETKFGMAVACVLQDPAGGGIINVFLPKSVQLSSDEIQQYNQHETDPVNLIFRDPIVLRDI